MIKDIMTGEQQPVKLPSYLRTETIGTIPIEEPRFIPTGWLLLDKDGNIYVDRCQELGKTHRKLTTEKGRVALMLATLPDYETTGIIADLRMVRPGSYFSDAAGDEAPDDQEYFSDWEASRKCEAPVVAVYSRNPDTKEDEPSGDEMFYDNLRYLASKVDAERAALRSAKKKQEKKAKVKKS